FDILFKNRNCLVGHEFILKFKDLEKLGYSILDVAKRLIDYGFHPPTVHWPVPHALMIEPTETEPINELNRFVEALLNIKTELEKFRNLSDNPVKNSPHAFYELLETWSYSYPPSIAFPEAKNNRFIPSVKRLLDSEGDRALLVQCGCIMM
ncbi:MAG: glycine dehydrogenase (aminomethyl-transferring), partial [Deltaproteobacteria bacterium]|nr:glycine dehydrogenase (aminomethyl-transferring) [Deltaproteobacteria bacterium]